MKTSIRFHEVEPSQRLRQHTATRMLAAFGRFGSQITSVLVSFGDINGPKGGIDCTCLVVVRGPVLGTVVVRELTSDAFASADRGIARAARVVRRRINKARGGRHLRQRTNQVEVSP